MRSLVGSREFGPVSRAGCGKSCCYEIKLQYSVCEMNARKLTTTTYECLAECEKPHLLGRQLSIEYVIFRATHCKWVCSIMSTQAAERGISVGSDVHAYL
jgi:hypothetical protein